MASVATPLALFGVHTLIGEVVRGFELPVILWRLTLAVVAVATVSTLRLSLRRGRESQLERDLGIEEVDDAPWH